MHARESDIVSLIVNGDDFGASQAVNAALMRCHREGVLTSATVLVNRPAADEAITMARASPSLGIGLHLNLTDGAPLSPPATIPSLVDRDGRLRAFPAQLLRIVGGQARIAEVEREFRAQIEFMLARGLSPTHLDGHLHVHAYPRLPGLVLRLMNEYGIRGMRPPVLTAWAPLYLDARLAARSSHVRAQQCGAAARRDPLGEPTRVSLASFAAGMSRRGRNATLVAHGRIVTVDFMLDAATFLSGTDPVGALGAALGRVPGGRIELMTHPGFVRDAARGAAEVALLTAPRLRAMLEISGIRRVHYGQLPDSR